jgi:hypothetical protein
MANPNLNTPSPNAQPNQWYHEGMWREVLSPHDEIGARRARHALAAEGLYPTRDQAGDPGLAVMEANHRAALHQIVAELEPTDLTALFKLARLLLLAPREPGLFEWIEANTQATLCFWVVQGVLPAEVLEG